MTRRGFIGSLTAAIASLKAVASAKAAAPVFDTANFTWDTVAADKIESVVLFPDSESLSLAKDFRFIFPDGTAWRGQGFVTSLCVDCAIDSVAIANFSIRSSGPLLLEKVGRQPEAERVVLEISNRRLEVRQLTAMPTVRNTMDVTTHNGERDYVVGLRRDPDIHVEVYYEDRLERTLMGIDA